jgi:hypothetical protein
VLEATVRNPGGRSPSARLIRSLEDQERVGVGRQPTRCFHAGVGVPTRAKEANPKMDATI